MLLAPQHLIGRHVRVAAQTSSSQRMRCLFSQQAGRLAVGEGGRPGATKPLWGHDGFAPCGWAERVEEWLRYRSLRPVVAEQP